MVALSCVSIAAPNVHPLYNGLLMINLFLWFCAALFFGTLIFSLYHKKDGSTINALAPLSNDNLTTRTNWTPIHFTTIWTWMNSIQGIQTEDVMAIRNACSFLCVNVLNLVLLIASYRSVLFPSERISFSYLISTSIRWRNQQLFLTNELLMLYLSKRNNLAISTASSRKEHPTNKDWLLLKH